MFRKTYTLHKSRAILKTCYKWYQSRWKTLPKEELEIFEHRMQGLDEALLNKDKIKATTLAKELETYAKAKIKTTFHYAKELVIALSLALIFAVVVRQAWFEFYEIPTGSMRPTYREQDRLVVTKTPFGINLPLTTSHLYFDPDLVKRTGVVVWSGDNIDLPDVDTTYFGLFPYKKRYIKRLIGKPGDTLYFYGGQVWGLDANGQEIKELRESPALAQLEYIPFSQFEGRMQYYSGKEPSVTFKFFNIPLGRLNLKKGGQWVGELFDGKTWKPEKEKRFADAYGLGNFAVARLVTKGDLASSLESETKNLEEAPLYLQLYHHPSLTYPAPTLKWLDKTHSQIVLQPFVSLIPLHQKEIDRLMQNLYTARFVVTNGQAKNYSAIDTPFTAENPYLPNVPDGTYEFYYGKAYKIDWGGVATLLPPEHPLYKSTPEQLLKLFNMGIRFSNAFDPGSPYGDHLPNRYAYYRDGSLYVMGAPFLDKEAPLLNKFIQSEEKRAETSNTPKKYIPFIDSGRPVPEIIKEFGLKIPEKNYIVLGDNHAMSADSRYFGFVPEDNLQGAPSFIFWPAGNRWGFPAYSAHTFFNIPTMVIWFIALILFAAWYAWHHHRIKQPIYKKLSHTQVN